MRALKVVLVLAVIAIAVLAVVVTVVFLAGESAVLPAGTMEITAVTESAAGVAATSEFQILAESLSLTEISKTLSVMPEFAYHLTGDAGVYQLQPDAPLQEDVVYRFDLGSGSWAFQTATALKVVASAPANGEAAVISRGINIAFSRYLAEAAVDSVSLEPNTPGTWAVNRDVLTFTPSGVLAADTLYRISLAAGLPAEDGEALGAPLTLAFRTAGGSAPRLVEEQSFVMASQPSESFGIRLRLEGATNTEGETYANIYEVGASTIYIKLIDEYASTLHPTLGKDGDVLLDTTTLTSVREETGTLTLAGGSAVLPIPNLGTGFYLVDYTVKGEGWAFRRQKLLAVSELALYTQPSGEQLLCWVNDVAAGGALGGAEITQTSGENVTGAVTSREGIASLALGTLPAGTATVVTVKAADGREHVNLVGLSSVASVTEPSGQDAVGLYSPHRVSLFFDREEYAPGDEVRFAGHISPWQKSGTLPAELRLVYAEAELVLAVKDGGFSGSFVMPPRLGDAAALPLVFHAEGEVVYAKNVSYLPARLSPYTVDIDFDKSTYLPSEKMQMTITATYREGDPARGLRLRAEDSFSSVFGTVGEDGVCVLVLNEPEAMSFLPYYDEITVMTEGVPGAEIVNKRTVLRFPSGYMVKPSLDVQPGGLVLTCVASRLNFSAAETALGSGLSVDSEQFYQLSRGEGYEQYANARLVRCEYTGTEGTEIRESILDSLSFSTVSGVYTSPVLPYLPEEGAFYKIILEYETPDGVNLREEIDTRGGAATAVPATPNNTTDNATDSIPTTLNLPAATAPYSLVASQPDFETGERIELYVVADDAVVGTLFYCVYQDDMLRAEVTETANFSILCTENFLPGFTVGGAFFDGERLYELAPLTLTTRQPTEASLQIQFDKENYAPGETVKAVLKAEGAFTYALSAGEVFLTGSSGRGDTAEVTWTLPQQETTLVVTAQVVTESGKMGSVRKTLRLGGLLGLEIVTSENYAAKDEIITLLRSSSPDTVNYEAVLSGGGEEKNLSGSFPPGKPHTLTFAPTAPGRYTLKVEATTAAGMEVRSTGFTVSELRGGEAFLRFLPLESVTGAGAGLPVFYETADLRTETLLFLAGAAGERADASLARALASRELIALNPETAQYLTAVTPLLAQEGGGLRYLAHGVADSLLTAKAVAAAPEWLDLAAARTYFYQVLLTEREPALLGNAYLGLAALGEPVLLDLRQLIANTDERFSLRDCLHLATGLALLGDKTGAESWYESNLRSWLSANGVDTGLATEDHEALTGEAAVLTAYLGREETASLLSVVRQTKSATYQPYADIMMLLPALPPLKNSALLRYELAGKQTELNFQGSAVHFLALSQAERQAAVFATAKGQVTAALFNAHAPVNVTDTEDKITVDKTYSQSGETVRVTIDVSFQNGAPADVYSLTDVLPAGLRFLYAEADEGGHYFTGAAGESVSFVLDRVQESGTRRDITADFQVIYYARPAISGSFSAEGAIVRHAGSNLCVQSETAVLTV